MTTIFAIVICSSIYSIAPNVCSFPENGMTYFSSAEECKHFTEMTNREVHRNKPRMPDLKCVSKSGDAWKMEE